MYVARNDILMIMFILSCALLIAGCKEDFQSPDKNLTKAPEKQELAVTASKAANASQQGSDKEAEAASRAAEQEQGSGTEQGGPYCGDGVCSGSENCDRCHDDCACKSPAECHNGVCKTPECGSDGECKDEDDCTNDICYFAQHVNAYCAHEQIEKCRNKDGCCPEGCNAGTDSDCEPECGNDVCEPGETSDKCYDDCGPVCGNGNCESGETANSCPADCYQPTCGDRNCETGEDYSNCAYDCCEPDKWYQDGTTCNCPGGYNRVTDPGFYMCTKS